MISQQILWLARSLPFPANAGDKIYTLRLAEAVAAAGAHVHFVGLAPEEVGTTPLEMDTTVTWEVIGGKPVPTLLAMFKSLPLVAARFGTSRYRARLEALLKKSRWDAIVLDQYALSWALPLISLIPSSYRPIFIHIAHDFETDVNLDIATAFKGHWLRKLAMRWNASKTALAEAALAKAVDLMVVLTRKDQESFGRIGASCDSLILPPGYSGVRRHARSITTAVPRQVAIVGSYRWTAKQINLAAFLQAADGIFADANIALCVVGDIPEKFVADWRPRLKATQFLHFVDDLAGFLDQCRVGLMIEAIGGGFKLKILDYVFMRVPVAALRQGLGGQDGSVIRHFLLADDAAELARQVVASIDQLEYLNDMQDQAYEAARGQYSWECNGRQLVTKIEAMKQKRIRDTLGDHPTCPPSDLSDRSDDGAIT